MTKAELIERATASSLTSSWHWFNYHFKRYLLRRQEPMVESLLDALLQIDFVMPGYAAETLDRLANIGGREKFHGHFDQLIQTFAEIFVIAQLSAVDWQEAAAFDFEPGANLGRPNPEIAIQLAYTTISIEVKAPSWNTIKHLRSKEGLQLLARLSKELFADEQPVLPRDNSIKDFLLSASTKFRAMRERSAKSHYGILVIVWDDYIQEPLSALLSPASGLFTQQSFLKDASGSVETFAGVDGVILLRHLHQMVRSTAERDFIDNCRHTFDYGSPDAFPPKAFVQNPWSQQFVPSNILKTFQARPWYELLGAEYVPAELIHWIVNGSSAE